MTKEEFVLRVMAAVEDGKLEKLDEIYEELLARKAEGNYPEIQTRTSGGEEVTVRWGTP